MKNGKKPIYEQEDDGQASSRKEDHIELAFKSAVDGSSADARFEYEPMLNGHQKEGLDLSTKVAGKQMSYPIWISSMTGGTERAKQINHNLAKLCGEYGLGMGLGSCRQLLYEDIRTQDFDVRQYMPEAPLMANLGIAQVEDLLKKGEAHIISNLVDKLSADGLIVHVNPLQEWMQPEGDLIQQPPIDTVKELLSLVDYPIMVKEVGQGFGRKSLEALLALPLEAIELAGYGGTNFSKLELLRSDELRYEHLKGVFSLGHTCKEMVDNINAIREDGLDIQCKKIIISGGVKSFLDGYYFTQKCELSSLYAQASAFLKYATDADQLKRYLELQIEGLKMSHTLLKVK